MAEYIEKDALVRMLRAKAEMGRLSEYSVCFDNVAKMIELLPAADVEEVKHGKWMGKQLDNFRKYEVTCSNCGWIGIENYDSYNDPSDFNYCPNCGAKMDGGDGMIKIYGVSDDLVEIEGSTYEEDEIDCYDKDVLIDFVDGTRIRVHYGKQDSGVWKISIEKVGTARQILTECNDEDADIYSDVLEIDAEIRRHKVVDCNG